ncbi:MAG: 16S rRNA (cytosine(967)-C(5))-methyltransferase RsmB [Clostridia bacterium]|nr:16S rRNA (cytosine(967)-C(5))-methyltransferase RsmB [Clostridia bacterium]
MKNSRQTAFEILCKIQKDSSYSNLTVDNVLASSGLNDSDSAFVSALVYGVLERSYTLDYQLSLNLKQPLKKLKPQVLTALRLGVYQLLFMDKVPESAAVNESVKLVKSNGCAFAGSLVNAVLRSVSRNGLCLPDESDKSEYYSVKYSFPTDLVRFWIKHYGENNAVGIMASCAGRPPLTVRVNTLKTDGETLADLLRAENISVQVSSVDNSLCLGKCGSLEKLSAFNDGLFHVQDGASQLCAAALAPQEGETVIDLCAAPGGKSFTLAQLMKNTGRIIACDIHNHRLELIRQGAQRLGVTIIECVCNDASVFSEQLPMADKVLCDVPCSGLGIVRRKPEIRNKPLDDLKALPPIQLHILETASKYVKNGGRLVYSTCALNPNENEKVCKSFLSSHPDFSVVTPNFISKSTFVRDGFITLMPHINDTDGFFIAVFERK